MTDLRARAANATALIPYLESLQERFEGHDTLSVCFEEEGEKLKQVISGLSLITDLLAALDGAENAALEKKDISTAPKDGSIFWSLDGEKWRKTRFCSISETMKELGGGPELYNDVWCNPDDTSDNWEPKIWLPLNALLKNPGATP